MSAYNYSCIEYIVATSFKELLTKDFPITHSMVKFALSIDSEVSSDTGIAWYFNLTIRACIAIMLFVMAVPSVFFDSIVKLISIFNITGEDIMSFQKFINDLPVWVKKIGFACCAAAASILLLNAIAASMSVVILGLKCLVAMAAASYIIGVIKEHEFAITSIKEQIKDSISKFFNSCTTKVSNFFHGVTNKSTPKIIVNADKAANVVAPDHAPQSYIELIYNKMPSNPFAGAWDFCNSKVNKSQDTNDTGAPVQQSSFTSNNSGAPSVGV